MPSQAQIQCECAFTYMNAVFRKNLTDALAVDANDVDAGADTGGALSDVNDRARSYRTNGKMHLERERPPAGRAWGEEGGRQMGVAHASLAHCSAATAARTPKPAAQSAAGTRRESADWREDRASVIM